GCARAVTRQQPRRGKSDDVHQPVPMNGKWADRHDDWIDGGIGQHATRMLAGKLAQRAGSLIRPPPARTPTSDTESRESQDESDDPAPAHPARRSVRID